MDLDAIPNAHKSTQHVDGWTPHTSGFYISSLTIAKHRMRRETPTEFTYTAWRHGGWYVAEIAWPDGGTGCVSNNYADRCWRFVCDPRPFNEQDTFGSRDDAARGEWEFVKALVESTPW